MHRGLSHANIRTAASSPTLRCIAKSRSRSSNAAASPLAFADLPTLSNLVLVLLLLRLLWLALPSDEDGDDVTCVDRYETRAANTFDPIYAEG